MPCPDKVEGREEGGWATGWEETSELLTISTQGQAGAEIAQRTPLLFHNSFNVSRFPPPKKVPLADIPFPLRRPAIRVENTERHFSTSSKGYRPLLPAAEF